MPGARRSICAVLERRTLRKRKKNLLGEAERALGLGREHQRAFQRRKNQDAETAGARLSEALDRRRQNGGCYQKTKNRESCK